LGMRWQRIGAGSSSPPGQAGRLPYVERATLALRAWPMAWSTWWPHSRQPGRGRSSARTPQLHPRSVR